MNVGRNMKSTKEKTFEENIIVEKLYNYQAKSGHSSKQSNFVV